MTNSVDTIIEIYERDVDVTRIDEWLKRTVQERLRVLEEFEWFREELRAAMEKRRDPVRWTAPHAGRRGHPGGGGAVAPHGPARAAQDLDVVYRASTQTKTAGKRPAVP